MLMMKLHTLIIVILLLLLSIAMSTVTPSDPKAPSEDLKKFIEDLNTERRRVAGQCHISNMHELVWDEDLQREADKFEERIVEQLNALVAKHRCYFDFIKAYDEQSYINNDRSKFLITNKWQSETEFLAAYNVSVFLYPKQTTVACRQFKEKLQGKSGICLYGTQLLNEVKPIRGEPASNCWPSHQRKNDKLCAKNLDVEEKPSGPSTAKPTTTTLPPPLTTPKVITSTAPPPLPPPNLTTTIIAAEVMVPSEVNSTVSSNPKPTERSEYQVTSGAPKVLTSSKAPAAPTQKPPPLISRPVPTLPAELRDYVEMDGDEYDSDFPTDSPMKTSGRSFGLFFLFFIMVVLKVQ